MSKLKKVMLTMLAASLFSGTMVVYAEKVDVDGGTWKYGYNRPVNAFSEYYHSYNNHGAKVVNANNGANDFKNAGPGVWAKASIWNVWDPATFYYSSNGHYSH